MHKSLVAPAKQTHVLKSYLRLCVQAQEKKVFSWKENPGGWRRYAFHGILSPLVHLYLKNSDDHIRTGSRLNTEVWGLTRSLPARLGPLDSTETGRSSHAPRSKCRISNGIVGEGRVRFNQRFDINISVDISDISSGRKAPKMWKVFHKYTQIRMFPCPRNMQLCDLGSATLQSDLSKLIYCDPALSRSPLSLCLWPIPIWLSSNLMADL